MIIESHLNVFENKLTTSEPTLYSESLSAMTELQSQRARHLLPILA